MLLFALPIVVALASGLETDPEFKQGQQQIDAFEYEKAAATFDHVAKRASLGDADRAVALVWLGLACAELRDQARAAVAFEDAVTADPLIVLPRDASPKIKALLEDARARVRLRPKPQPENTAATATNPTTTNATTATNPTTTTNATQATTTQSLATQAPAAPTSAFVPVAIGTAVVGGVVALAGGVVWGIGLALRQQAIDATFQSDANTFNEESKAAQIGGQVGLGVGVVALAAGGALFAVGEIE